LKAKLSTSKNPIKFLAEPDPAGLYERGAGGAGLETVVDMTGGVLRRERGGPRVGSARLARYGGWGRVSVRGLGWLDTP
jgi:hypothetical protein